MDQEGTQPNQEDAEAFLRRLGDRIRDLRRERHLSQEQLAGEADLVQHYVSQIEQGQRNVSITALRSIATALELTLAQMLEGLE
jgi:transcriptional regulator with XRE-family HTH domain